MGEREKNGELAKTAATNADEARAMVARMGGVVRAEEETGEELSDETLKGVAGGAVGGYAAGDRVYIDGPLYLTSYAEGYSGRITGYFTIQSYKPGRPAPYLIKSNVGWVEEAAVAAKE